MSDQVTNKNFLSPLNFKFSLKRAPHVNFFIQAVNLPGLSLPEIDVSNPLIRVPYAGDHLLYDELQITYKVDENLRNYMELHEWIRALGNYEVVFKDAFPTSVSGVDFTTTDEDVDYIRATATFRYTTYDITKVLA